MTDRYTVLSPENVELRYEVAGLGSRIAAALLDYVLLSVGYFALFFAGAMAQDAITRFLSGQAGRVAAGTVGAIALAIMFLGWWGYFVLFELFWNGQTPGKRVAGLRVVRQGGLPLGALGALVRNLLRVIDTSGIGLFVMLVDRSSRRLGDFAAGSLVVREPRAGLLKELDRAWLPEVDPAAVEALPNAGRITSAHYLLIRDYFSRRDRLRLPESEQLARRLTAELTNTLDLPPTADPPATLLATIARAYEARHRYRESAEL